MMFVGFLSVSIAEREKTAKRDISRLGGDNSFPYRPSLSFKKSNKIRHFRLALYAQ